MNPPNYCNQDIPCCVNCYYYDWDGMYCTRYPLPDITFSELGICDDYQKDDD